MSAPRSGILPWATWRMTLRICSNCLISCLTAWTLVPEPLAIRSLLEPFAPDRMASRILGMGDVLTLVERAQEQFDQKKAEEMVERSFAGRLTMDDWLAQLRQLRGMGSLEGVLGMLPGGRKMIQQAGAAMPSEQDLGRMEAIVLSMTMQERRHPELIKGSQRLRIARGSGTNVQAVKQLIKQFDQMRKVMRQVSQGRMPDLGAMMRQAR